MIIEQRYLPHILRESHRQFSARVYVAEQHVADGVCSLTAAKPYVEDGRHVFLLPSQRQRAAGEEGEDDGLAGLQ